MLKKNKKLWLPILALAVMMSFIGLYAGHFLLNTPAMPVTGNKADPVQHRHLSLEIGGNKQEADILEVDLSDGRVQIKPALSCDSVFGFEKLSAMASRSKAYAAVNAGFFYEYGQPAGMVVIDGEMMTNTTGRYPVFAISGQHAALAEMHTALWLVSGDKKLHLDGINVPGNPGEAILYTPAYGTDNRAKTGNIAAPIEHGTIIKALEYSDKAQIPEDGMLLTCYAPSRVSIPFKEGEQVEFRCEPQLGNDAQAYECGSWLVRNGQNVAGPWDEWVGIMTNHDPRTVIGLKDSQRVVLITIDGRQPGYSMGLTGKELGEFLISLGVRDAAMLDGGASTEMIINGRVINKPSYKGQERLLGGALIIKYAP